MSDQRRKNYFIDKTFQTKFALRFALLAGAAAALVAMLFMLLADQTITTGYQGSTFTVARSSRYFFPVLAMLSGLVGAGVALIGTLLFIYFSHRMAGPMHHLRTSLDRIGKGELDHRLQLRKEDQFQLLAQDVNQLAESLDKKVGELRRQLRDMPALDKDIDTQTLGDLKARLDRLKASADAFRTTP